MYFQDIIIKLNDYWAKKAVSFFNIRSGSRRRNIPSGNVLSRHRTRTVEKSRMSSHAGARPTVVTAKIRTDCSITISIRSS